VRLRFIGVATGAILCALTLAGCVDSSGPLLSDAQPLFGEQVRLQFYSLRKGFVDEPEQATYKWERGAYQRTSGGMTDIGSFSVHHLARDTFVVQSAAAKRPGMFEYAVARRLVDGVYQVIAIDEADAGKLTRTRYCRRTSDSSCRIQTRNQLYAFARATAEQRRGQGGLVLRLADSVAESSR
jgi:hypothetical protein